jgi:hypothetical protein
MTKITETIDELSAESRPLSLEGRYTVLINTKEHEMPSQWQRASKG